MTTAVELLAFKLAGLTYTSGGEVYLDGKRLGPLGSGFFDNLSIGHHSLEVKGDHLYWKENVILEAGKSTKINAYPRGFGFLNYKLPDDVSIEVTGVDFRRGLSGNGNLQLNISKS